MKVSKQNQTLCLELPGKIMLAGEYSVLLPGGTALAVSAGKVTKVSISVKTSGQYAFANIDLGTRWTTPDVGQDINSVPRSLRMLYAPVAILTRRWPIPPTLLQAQSVRGSFLPGRSSAVVAGVIECIKRILLTNVKTEQLLPYGIAAHVWAQGGGSGYDIVTTMLTGMVRFTAPANPFWDPLSGRIQFERSRLALTRDLATKVTPAKQLYLAVAHTGINVETRCRIANFRTAMQYGRFRAIIQRHLILSRNLVHLLVSSSTDSELLGMVSEVDSALRHLEPYLGPILVQPVRYLTTLARKNVGVPARISGTGGGDCVVAFSRDKERVAKLYKLWKERGIEKVAML